MSIKRLVSMAIILMICSMTVVGFARGKEQSQLDVYHINSEDGKLDFYLDGRDLQRDVGIYVGSNIYSIVEGNTFMQLRHLGSALNITLYWDNDTREVSFDANKESIKLKIGSKIAYIGEREVELNVAPFIKEGRTFIPLRFVSEALGINVSYLDLRQEGEFAKNAILEYYPSMANLIKTEKIKQGSKYKYPRISVFKYDIETQIMQIYFEDDKHPLESNSKWFEANIKNGTIRETSTGNIIIDGYEKESTPVKEEVASNLGKERNIPYRVKDYLANGQSELSNAEAFWWTDEHLEALTDEVINKLYDKFLGNGGNGENIVDFAEYLSMNAPVYPNWKKAFEDSISDDWDEIKITKYEDYGDGYVAVYIEGFESVYVNINTITGYYRG